MEVTDNYMPVVKINAPEFYKDPAFIAWLNAADSAVATWHRGGTPNEYSDIFMMVSDGDGSDSDMPEHIFNQIVAAVAHHGECLVWLQNLT